MNRPLMNKGIDHLEQLFKSSGGDPKILRQLSEELAFRSTARASFLNASVKLSLGEILTDAESPEISEDVSRQTMLPLVRSELDEQTPAKDVSLEQEREDYPVRSSSGPSIQIDEALDGKSSDVANLALTIEAAYRLLKVSASAPWTVIENARREIVQKACPEALEGESIASRTAVAERAIKANEAVARIWRERYPTL